jgi:CTP synthase (UTP-ammonia lyase)
MSKERRYASESNARPASSVAVAVLMDLPEQHPYYMATWDALQHAARARTLKVDIDVIRTDRLADPHALPYAAVVIGPGSPYRDPEAVLTAIRSARERGVPLVGT